MHSPCDTAHRVTAHRPTPWWLGWHASMQKAYEMLLAFAATQQPAPACSAARHSRRRC